MEPCNSNTPTGESGQIGGHQGAINSRARAARRWVATAADPDLQREARNDAIDAHIAAAAHPQHRP